MIGILLITLAAFEIVTADISLRVLAAGNEFHGRYIDHVNFAYGYKGALIANEPVPYLIHPTNHTLHEVFTNRKSKTLYNIGQKYNILIAEVGEPEIPAVVDESGFLSINGSRSVFYACPKLKWDPYGLADQDTPGVGIFKDPEIANDGCQPIKLAATNVFRTVH